MALTLPIALYPTDYFQHSLYCRLRRTQVKPIISRAMFVEGDPFLLQVE